MLTDAEDVVALAGGLLVAALDLPGLPQRHADLRHHHADRAVHAGDGRDDRIGPAVLGRDDEAARRQMTDRELGGPGGVVDLHGHERDLEVTRQPERLVEVIDGGARLERLVGPGHRDPALTDRLDLLGPGIDQRHVVTRAREKRAQVAADRARADEENLLAHSVPFSASRR